MLKTAVREKQNGNPRARQFGGKVRCRHDDVVGKNDEPGAVQESSPDFERRRIKGGACPLRDDIGGQQGDVVRVDDQPHDGPVRNDNPLGLPVDPDVYMTYAALSPA